MTTLLLILHGLVAVGLLGAITHQTASMFRRRTAHDGSFIDRYTRVNQKAFSTAIAVLFVASVVLGIVIYPAYRLDVRIPFEEMGLKWAVGVFELKEHFGGIGLGVLPLYVILWRPALATTHRIDRLVITSLLATIVWWNFLIGHVLNNIRGLG